MSTWVSPSSSVGHQTALPTVRLTMVELEGHQEGLRKAAKATSAVSSALGWIPFCAACSAASLALGVASAAMDKAGGGSWNNSGKSMLTTGVGAAFGGFGKLTKAFGRVERAYNSRLRHQGMTGVVESVVKRGHPLHSRRVLTTCSLDMHFATNGVTWAMGRL